MTNIDKLWHTGDLQAWEQALERYWDFVLERNLKLERSLEALNLERIRRMSPRDWYQFLKDEYFRWKYTAANRYAATTGHLERYTASNGFAQLDRVRERLLNIDPSDTAGGLAAARTIPGLGMAGASGLLALMYPHSFGTVDQFVVNALRQVSGLRESTDLARMNPERLTARNAVLLIGILQRKASDNNRSFGTGTWTPRKIDKVLWTCGRAPGPRCPAHTSARVQQPGPERTTSGSLPPMSTTVRRVPATIRALGQFYADGLERLEIWIARSAAAHLPISVGVRVPISLRVGGQWYDGGLRATTKNDYFWICGDVVDSRGEKTSLARVLRASGFTKNQKVMLDIQGNRICVETE